MTDLCLRALTRAWLITVLASAVLLGACATEQVWNSAAYWDDLPQAVELTGDDGWIIDGSD